MVARLLSVSIAIASLLLKLFTLCVSALVWDPYLAAVLLVVLNGRLAFHHRMSCEPPALCFC